MAYYARTLKIQIHADSLLARVQKPLRVLTVATDIAFAAVFTAYTILVLTDFVSTFINIEFLGRGEAGRLGRFLWSISLNRGDFYGLIWTVSILYILSVLLASLPLSPMASAIVRKRAGKITADRFDAGRTVIMLAGTVYLFWEVLNYAKITPQIVRSIDFLLQLL